MCTNHVSETCTPECTIILHQLTGSVVWRHRGTNGGGSGLPALAVHKKISLSLGPAVEKPVEQLREDIDSTPHIHSPESQLVTESVVWSGEDIEGTHQGRPSFFLQAYRDR